MLSIIGTNHLETFFDKVTEPTPVHFGDLKIMTGACHST